MQTRHAMICLLFIVLLSLWITPETKAEEKEKTVTAATDNLNVRSGPGLHHPILTTLAKGEKYPFIQKEKDWIQIQLSGQKKGWVADYLVFVNEEKSADISGTKLRILHNGTNIRKEPSTQARILERANEGDSYEAIEWKNDWYQIKLANGEIGYVASWIVTQISENERNEENSSPTYPSLKNKTIVIDPGHGGEDGGTVGVSGTLEKRLTLETARLLSKKLEDAGANVILTRSTDLSFPLNTRVATASYRNADAFISLHYDHAKDKNVHGLTTYFYHPWQKELAVELHSAVMERTKQKDRGVRFGDYYVIRENNKKAVLIELGYLSNPAEELLVLSEEYQKSAATGIYEGLGRYFNN